MKTKRTSFLARTAMTLLFTVLTTVTTWADPWPSYITNVVLVGGTESEAQSAKSDYSGYTWCSKSLNDGTSGDVIYIGYKTSNSANTNGGYITDFIVVDAEDHNPPSSVTCNGHTYYLCPADGGDYFANSNHGNLTSHASLGWNIYLYYTKEHFSDKRAVSSIAINDTKSGAIDCYKKDGTLLEENISLNRGVKNTPYVYMHIYTSTKVNRPNPEPTTNSGLTYNGSPLKLISSNYTNYNSGTVYYRVGSSGSYTSDVNNVTATNAGTYTIYYYSGESYYGNSSVDYAHTISATIAKSPNSGLTVSCSNYLEGTAPVPSLVGTNLSTGTVTYKYSTSQNGTYTTTVPSEPGTYWVKATIAGDSNCFDYTTAPVSFTITYNWKLHNSGDTEDDAYVISTIVDLKYLAIWVNLGNNFEGKFFKLGDNIAFDKSKENNFTPIGNSTYSFTGTFDGQGHTISGLNINKPDKDNVGLFGNTEEATIKNLIVDNSTINGKMSTGAIVGHSGNFVTVTNCRVTNSVTVSGTSQVGGITGVSSTVSGCVSAAAVSGSSFVGGIIGNGNFSSIANNLYTGTSINCPDIYKGAIVGEINGYTTLTANYYTADLSYKATANNNDINGACRAVVINTVDGVTVTPTGDATVYNVSGITAYTDNSGMLYSDGTTETLYAGATETVSLDITYGIDGFSVLGYTDGVGSPATDLTLVSDNTYTLTMTADAPTVTPVGNDLWGVTTAGRDGSTADKAYIITTTEGLDLLASKVNSGTNYNGKYFELGDDIEYDGTANNYTPIGTEDHAFAGRFDGKGHTVSGINIVVSTQDYRGLFGKIGSAEVKNLTLDNSRIVGRLYCGGIAGYNYKSTISNCHVTSSVTIHASSPWADSHGGIVGHNDQSSIIGCTSSADVTASSNLSSAPYFGGIAGFTSGTIRDCLVYGGSINGSDKAGAVLGKNSGGTLTNNHYSGVTLNGSEALLNAGVGSGSQDGAQLAYEFPTAISAMGAKGTTYAAGTDYEGVTAYANGLAYNGKYYYPSLWTGDGTSDNPYIIYTTAGLDKLASDVNGGETYADTYFELGNDITYSYAGLAEGESNYTAIGKYNGSNDVKPFSGHFDGKGHTISGIRITKDGGGFKDSYQGVFGYIRNATVKNVKLTDTRITAADHIGGIAGFNSASTIENCHVTNTVTIQSNGNSEIYLGGIAGELHDYNGVDPCVRGCTSAATVSGDTEVGGIVGKLYDGSIIDCLYLGTSVTGTYHIGAIVGHNVNNTLSNNYYTTYGLGGVGDDGIVIGSDVAGACFANEYPAATGAMGAVVSTYGTGDYTGMTVYTDGLAYKGKYYCPLPWTGDGTAEHPFVISTTDGLNKLAIKVNAGTSYSGKYFELGNDITYSYDGLAEGESNFTTIGENGYWFYGTFDGKGHTVSGIRISDTNGAYKAIFGWVNGTVKNLVVSDCSIEARQDIGGIVAQLYSGTIENCHVLSDVTLSGNMYVGGIAGDLEGGTIKGCTSAAKITGTTFAGSNANWLGGIVGSVPDPAAHPLLTDNLFIGTISGNLDEFIGAIVGWNNCGENILTNNYHTLSGMGGVGNENDATSSDEDGATIAYELAAANAAMGAVGSTYGTGDYTGITAYENGLAYNGKFYSPSPWGGNGTEEDPYIIFDTTGLDLLAKIVNSPDNDIVNFYAGTYFVLGADITYDKTKENNFTTIGNKMSRKFCGHLDGKGHTVSGIRINLPENDYVGLFGLIESGSVKNLTVTNSTIMGQKYVGNIAGYASDGAAIENCHVTSDCDVNGTNYVGGIIGAIRDNSIIMGCTSAATISGNDMVGGIVGVNSSTIQDCLYTGTSVTASSTTVGAIVGLNNSDTGTLTNNYHTCSGMGGVGEYANVTSSDVDGAQFVVSSETMPDGFGDVTKIYGTGSYIGVKAYGSNGLEYDGKYYKFSLWTGSGTSDAPYVIYTTAGLDKLANDVNGGTNFKNTYFELGADITYDWAENNFTPIGNNNNMFKGHFDGKGHKVSGLNINLPEGESVGLFGCIESGSVKNLTLASSSITAKDKAAGIIGRALDVTIENCHVLSNVAVSSTGFAGGIVGSHIGNYTMGCTSAAIVSGSEFVGGIVGFDNSATIQNCLYTGNDVSGSNSVGAIVGRNSGDYGPLINNYHTCSGMGGVGSVGSTTGSDKDGAQFALSSDTEPDEATIGTAGTAYAYQGITPYTKGLYYKGQYYYNDPNIVAWAGQGTAENPYVIRTTTDLDLLATNVNGGTSYVGKYFVLGADITYDRSENNYTPIGDNYNRFSGHFDGKGHTISGININQPEKDWVGLFGFVYSGSVKNLTLANSTIIGQQDVGSIAGQVAVGTAIENCHVTSDCDLNGTYAVGSIVGSMSNSSIVGSMSNSTIGGCTSAATVSGTQYVSGIVGSNNGSTIKDCLYMGNVVSATPWAVGAIVGYNISDAATLTNNYYTQSGVGGVNGSDEAGKAEFAVSSTTKPDAATIGTAGTPYAEDETYQGITPYSKGLYYDGRYYWHEAFLRGDANGDGQVTITDAVAVVNYILGNPSENFNKAAANVNGDTDEHGEPVISITDAVGIVNIILNSAASTPAFTAPALTAPEDDDASPVDPE